MFNGDIGHFDCAVVGIDRPAVFLYAIDTHRVGYVVVDVDGAY